MWRTDVRQIFILLTQEKLWKLRILVKSVGIYLDDEYSVIYTLMMSVVWKCCRNSGVLRLPGRNEPSEIIFFLLNIYTWYHSWYIIFVVVSIFMSVIHDTQYLCRITSLLVCTADPIPSTLSLNNYWRNGNIGRLDTVTFRNLRPRPAYVLLCDRTELHAKFDHNRSKTQISMR